MMSHEQLSHIEYIRASKAYSIWRRRQLEALEGISLVKLDCLVLEHARLYILGLEISVECTFFYERS